MVEAGGAGGGLVFLYFLFLPERTSLQEAILMMLLDLGGTRTLTIGAD